jgi:hypothetical protein
MDKTVYSAEECQIGFFASSHESTDVLKNPRKAHGGFAGLLHRKTSTLHSNRVGGEAASEQAVTYMRDTRALLLRSKKWTKSSQRFTFLSGRVLETIWQHM